MAAIIKEMTTTTMLSVNKQVQSVTDENSYNLVSKIKH